MTTTEEDKGPDTELDRRARVASTAMNASFAIGLVLAIVSLFFLVVTKL